MKKLSKKRAGEILANVPEDKVFWLNDGRALRNLDDLMAALADMSKETFSYHVNKEKNDFKDWIEFVISDEKLSKDISKTKSKGIFAKKIDKRIGQLRSAVK